MKKLKCAGCGAEFESDYGIQYYNGKAYVKCPKGDGFAFEVEEEKVVKPVAKKTTTTRKKQATQKEEEV